ncbi:hypothetical protein HID58_054312, partial [Brassica napus]
IRVGQTIMELLATLMPVTVNVTSCTIPTEKFQFQKYEQLLALANSDVDFPVSTFYYDETSFQRLMLTIQRETMVCISIFDLVANLLHEKLYRAQEGSSSSSSKYGGIKKLESVTLSELNSTIAQHLLISHTRSGSTYLLIVQTLLVGEDHSDNDMTWAVNLSVESNPIVNNIGLDNTNRCDASATMEGCLEVSEPIPTQTGPVVNTKEETMDGDKDPNLKKPRNALSLPLLANFFLNSISS